MSERSQTPWWLRGARLVTAITGYCGACGHYTASLDLTTKTLTCWICRAVITDVGRETRVVPRW